MITFEPLGDRAFLARFASNDEARGWSKAVGNLNIAGVVDVVLAYRDVAVYADPARTDMRALSHRLSRIVAASVEGRAGKLVTVPVLYDGEDLASISSRCNLTMTRLVSLHSGRVYRVLAIGFLAGFPYAGGLDRALAGLPRRARPRTQVPAGSVAIVGDQTCIYPSDSPGGWHLIGRTPLRIVDVASGHFPIRAGDLLRFEPIGENEYQSRLGEILAP